MTRRRRVRVGAIALLLAAGLLGPGAGLAAAKLSWSGPLRVDHNAGISLTSVACPTAGQCTAADQYGRVVSFDPRAPHPAPGTVLDLATFADLACPAQTLCTGVDRGGRAISFDPRTPGRAVTATVDVAGNGRVVGFAGVACPALTQCTAIDYGGAVVTFDPQAPAPVVPIAVDPGDGELTRAIACPSVTQCTVTGADREVTFDPAAPSGAQPVRIARGDLLALACPALNQCTAIEGSGTEVTFDPQGPVTVYDPNAPAASGVVTIDSAQPLGALACPATSQCTVVDQGARELTFDPRAPGRPAAHVIDVHAGGDLINQDGGLLGVACPSVASCTAVDGDGHAVSFSPAAPGHPSAAQVNPGVSLQDLACPLSTECAGADGTQAVSFDPVSGRVGRPRLLSALDSGPGISALACPLGDQCTALDPQSQVTFSPRPGRRPRSAGRIDPLSDIGMQGLACPLVTRCVAVDGNGGEVLFDPRSGAVVRGESVVSLGDSLQAVACPSLRQCTAVDNDGTQLTFSPVTGRRIAQATIDPAVGLDAPSGDSTHELDAIACPSVRRCVAVDTRGGAVSFDPRSRRDTRTRWVDPGTPLVAVSCASRTLCVAVDAFARALVGTPAVGTWRLEAIAAATPLTAVRCPSRIECIAVDSVGNAFVGVDRAPAATREWLARLLVPRGRAPRIGTVAAARGERLRFAALYPARLRIGWFAGHRLIASGSLAWSRREDARLAIRLTAAGRRRLAAGGRLALVAVGRLQARGRATVTVRARFVLAR